MSVSWCRTVVRLRRGINKITTRRISDQVQVSLELFEKCENIVGAGNISKAPAVLEQHSHDESYHRGLGRTSSVVVWPTTVEEVSEVAKLCSLENIPIIPFGTGTGLEGGVIPVKGGFTINLTKMDQILDLHVDDFDVTVQPGVTRKALNHYLKESGLWFPVDPGADASLCGMAATGASGTNAVRYGTMKENVVNLQVVLADGTIIHTAGDKRRFKKSSAGYNLTNIFVGSEGTLGLITSATLRLHAMPECTLSAVCSFDTVEDAVTCTTNVIQAGIPIARMEFLDVKSIQATNKFSQMSYPEKPSLFLEFHGSVNGAHEQVESTSEIVSANNRSNFKWAKNQEEINKLWQARHNLLYAIQALFPGCFPYSTDVCVPISQLPEAISYCTELIASTGLIAGTLGHVGDGNFHCCICVNPNDEKEISLVKEVSYKIGSCALRLGGTCTGEHGIGLGKKQLLVEEMGVETINVMKTIKSALDPRGLMNPGKIF